MLLCLLKLSFCNETCGTSKKKMAKTIFTMVPKYPASKKTVIGVFDKNGCNFAEALKENGVVHAFIVLRMDGWNITICKNKVVELKDSVQKFIIDPKTLGINSTNKENLKGKNPEYNSEKIVEIFRGQKNEFSQSVALNAAAGLIVSGKESDFKISYEKASKHLNSGNVFQHLVKIQSNWWQIF